MTFFYIFTNSRYDNMVYIGYSDSWKKRFSYVQEHAFKGDIVDVYATYELDDKDDIIKEFSSSIVDKILPRQRYITPDGTRTHYYRITKEAAYELLKTIATLSGTLDKLVLYTDASAESASQESTDQVTDEDSLSQYRQVVDDLLHGKYIKEKVAESVKNEKSLTSNVNTEANFQTKEGIVLFLREHGFSLSGSTITKAHVNAKWNHYWANPSLTAPEDNWSIILDDDRNKIFYVFEVPAGSVSINDLKIRNDIPRIELEIRYDDPSFTDKCSGIKFAEFKVGEISYASSLEQATSNKDNASGTPNKPTSASLSQIPKGFINHTILEYEFLGSRKRCTKWKEPLDEIMAYLYGKYPIEMRNLAKGPFYHSPKAKFPFLTLNISDIAPIDFPHEIKDSGIYYKTNYDLDAIISIMKMMMERFREDPNMMTITYF